MTTQPSSKKGLDSLSMALGALLIVLGLVFLIAQFIDINIGSWAWPFFVIVPGVLLFVFALTLKGSAGEVLAAVGAMASMTGLILFYQNTTEHWQSWAYMWALVAPTAAGLGQLFYGTLHSRPEMVRTGVRIAGVGLIIWLLAAFFFELVIGISGSGIGVIGWSLILILLGIAVIARPWIVALFRQ
ncbi:MAG: hypothetical protein KF893_08485 [Caldilineaceae bacterium]|nr:hypothetical protein [Caldilineaceae bacterium]